MVKIVYNQKHSCINVCLYPAFKSLGERWAAVCRWTEERWHKLQEVFMVWQQLLSDQVGHAACSHQNFMFFILQFNSKHMLFELEMCLVLNVGGDLVLQLASRTRTQLVKYFK